MGKSGDKLTDASTQAAEDLQVKLASLGEVTIKKMFGGHGVFESGLMFALVDSSGVVFFKVDQSNRQQYLDAGSRKHGRMPYYQVPAQVLERGSDLREWATISLAVARAAKK